MSGRATWSAAVGGDIQSGQRKLTHTRQTSARDQVGHTKLKVRQPGQGSRQDVEQLDLKRKLEEKERKFYEEAARIEPGKEGGTHIPAEVLAKALSGPSAPSATEETEGASLPADIDADDDESQFGASSGDENQSDSGSDDSDSDSDDEAQLMRELERIKRERAEEQMRKELARKEQEEEEKAQQVLYGNPLLNQAADAVVKRRWDDDVVFKNQARTEPVSKKRFINDPTRNDFHRRFLEKFIQ